MNNSINILFQHPFPFLPPIWLSDIFMSISGDLDNLKPNIHLYFWWQFDFLGSEDIMNIPLIINIYYFDILFPFFHPFGCQTYLCQLLDTSHYKFRFIKIYRIIFARKIPISCSVVIFGYLENSCFIISRPDIFQGVLFIPSVSFKGNSKKYQSSFFQVPQFRSSRTRSYTLLKSFLISAEFDSNFPLTNSSQVSCRFESSVCWRTSRSTWAFRCCLLPLDKLQWRAQ